MKHNVKYVNITYAPWPIVTLQYDTDMARFVVQGPENVAKKLAELVPESKRKEFKIIDIAAGTGNVGLALHKRGFRTMDANGK